MIGEVNRQDFILADLKLRQVLVAFLLCAEIQTHSDVHLSNACILWLYTRCKCFKFGVMHVQQSGADPQSLQLLALALPILVGMAKPLQLKYRRRFKAGTSAQEKPRSGYEPIFRSGPPLVTGIGHRVLGAITTVGKQFFPSTCKPPCKHPGGGRQGNRRRSRKHVFSVQAV